MISATAGRPMLRFKWIDPRGVCVYNQEGRHQELGRAGDIIVTRLVPESALARWIAAGQAIRL